ncbi:hypothetical protein PCASD_23342 [Puccinia coronata f. sp. avenae]|uniref:Uncharacterized protein n=1 Tax=Puccinia coronata f. sp. avenae TaxID=200324 RepID=A0A2N5S0K1_9BASI|nr:hypothetical protein PCASD_23342 [Puccinia coronata f. sp. avenae]
MNMTVSCVRVSYASAAASCEGNPIDPAEPFRQTDIRAYPLNSWSEPNSGKPPKQATGKDGKVAFMLPRPPHTQKLVSSFLDLPKLRLTNALQAKESLVPPETRRFFSALLVIGLLVPARTGRLSTIDPLPFLTPLVVVLSSPTRHPQVQTSLPNSHSGSVPEPYSPFLKLGRLTLLARIEKVFNPPQGEEKVKELIFHTPASEFVNFTISHNGAPALEMELPPPLRPESIVACSSGSISTRGFPSPESQEGYLRETPVILEAMPKHPNSAGLIRHSSRSMSDKLLLDILPESRTHSLITPSNTRKSQYALVLETSLQPPISPEPTPTFDKSTSTFQQAMHSPNHSMSSTRSAGFSASSCLPQYATVLRPCLGELLTPPLTPPPNVPLPPIPTASPSTTRPDRTHSLSVMPRSHSANGILRKSPYPQEIPSDVSETVPAAINRPRSKSSPLRSEVKRASCLAPPPPARKLRFLSPPQSFIISDSGITDDTNPTSEEGEQNSIPIALFECSYSPPTPPPIIHNFVEQQYLPSTEPSAQQLSH